MTKRMSKLTKKEAGYIEPIEEIRCGTCSFYREGHCSIVRGHVSSHGCCNLWSTTNRISGVYISGSDVKEKLQK